MITTTYILEMAGVYRYNESSPAAMALCILFQDRTLASLGHNGSTACLVVLTLDRYWRFVHPDHRRKHYRRWMLYVGVLLPWLNGLATYLLPAIGTSRIVNGVCIVAGFWPSKIMTKVGMASSFKQIGF